MAKEVMIKVYDKDGEVIFTAPPGGEELEVMYAKEVLEEHPRYDSLIIQIGNLRGFPIEYEMKRIVEMAARRYDYRHGYDIKPFVVTPNNDIIFYEFNKKEYMEQVLSTEESKAAINKILEDAAETAAEFERKQVY